MDKTARGMAVRCARIESLIIHVDNIGSHRVAEKCGFTKEATAREAWYQKGKWHDVDVYTLTRAESDERRRDR